METSRACSYKLKCKANWLCRVPAGRDFAFAGGEARPGFAASPQPAQPGLWREPIRARLSARGGDRLPAPRPPHTTLVTACPERAEGELGPRQGGSRQPST